MAAASAAIVGEPVGCSFVEGGTHATDCTSNDTSSHVFAYRFCRCDREYDADLNPMYQCPLCQDWFHRQCIDSIALNAARDATRRRAGGAAAPPADGGRAEVQESEDPDEDIDSSFAFLCRGCLSHRPYSMLLPCLNRAARDDAAPTHAAAEQMSSALNTGSADAAANPAAADVTSVSSSGATAAIPAVAGASPSAATAAPASGSSSTVCSRLQSSHEADSAPPTDRFVPSHWTSYLCQCASCVTELTTAGLAWLLRPGEEEEEEDLDEEVEEDEGKEAEGAAVSSTGASSAVQVTLDPAFDLDRLAEAALARVAARLPRGVVIDTMGQVVRFKEQVKRHLYEWSAAHPGEVVTVTAIREVLSRVMSALAHQRGEDGEPATRRRRIDEQGDGDADGGGADGELGAAE
jgi:hypothetical protein